MNFPQYRKYPNNGSYFKINSLDEFEEVNFIGKKKLHHIFQAKIYPDKMLIQDMLNCLENRWVIIDEWEWKKVVGV
jgi:hypothetical protein